jgi:hypothetical protein
MKLGTFPGDTGVKWNSGKLEHSKLVIRDAVNLDHFQIIMPYVHPHRNYFSKCHRNV